MALNILNYRQASRSKWASAPFGFRLATVFQRIASPALDAWGRQMGALMLSNGVEDLPDPGPGWKGPKTPPERLPRGYLFSLAKEAFYVALKFTRNPLDAEDLLQDILLKMISEPWKIKSTDFKSARSYLLTLVKWTAQTKIRLRKEKSTNELADEGGSSLDVEGRAFGTNPYWVQDPRAYRRVEDLFTPSIWEHKVVPELKKIHPDMPLFFDTMLSDPQAEIKNVVQGLPHFDKSYQTWLNYLRRDVTPVLKQLAEAA
jgi:hypothetical protein